MSSPCCRCAADPQPANFGNPRACAFDESGVFRADNWNCATMNELRWSVPDEGGWSWRGYTARVDDESIGVVHIPESADTDELRAAFGEGDYYLAGWVVMTWYKSRGRTGSAVVVYDDESPRPLRLAEAEAIIAALQGERGEQP